MPSSKRILWPTRRVRDLGRQRRAQSPGAAIKSLAQQYCNKSKIVVLMASIFTYDPDPPRVASPWLSPQGPGSTSASPAKGCSIPRLGNIRTPPPGVLSDYNVTNLGPEPQEGPVEFKLHLLLRPRRTYSSSTTGNIITGSQRVTLQSQPTREPISGSPAPSNQSRQNRLQQLTTQLLWRLQQSSPYHASSSSDSVLPNLSGAEARHAVPSHPERLLPGLGGSRGALYEIGVSDDGTLVGLTEDEMEESLTNLRAMAASLRCSVEITRMVLVGNCEWFQELSAQPFSYGSQQGFPRKQVREALSSSQQAKLWVAEALVTPVLSVERRGADTLPDVQSPITVADTRPFTEPGSTNETSGSLTTEQLRITLTGPTTSGKSSLLGTLSTATLDNGRGKSRLSLLKHRHELASGVTSSVAQELLGYKERNSYDAHIKVVNYALGNVSSWNDIHASAEKGRLVFVSDSAGHPRYRRTIVRGLVGWAPHWAMLCLAADDGDGLANNSGANPSSQEHLGIAGSGLDLVEAHLDLCLKLETPLVIVITKFDLARSSLRQNLGKILSAIKAVGRVPAMLPPDQTKSVEDSDLRSIAESDASAVQAVVKTMNPENLKQVVPIIMTSSVRGTGIRLLHALLNALPIPQAPTSSDYVYNVLNPEQPACLFHVEDVFDLPATTSMQISMERLELESGIVVAGYLRFGTLAVGDDIEVGPFPPRIDDRTQTPSHEIRSFPSMRHNEDSVSGGLAVSHTSSTGFELYRHGSATTNTNDEWCKARIVSIRNLRLPVHRLLAGQVGTVGFVFNMSKKGSDESLQQLQHHTPKIRKGMVLAIPSPHMVTTGQSLQAASVFTASFDDEDINSVSVGSIVVIYIASIRTPARIVRLTPHFQADSYNNSDDVEDLFGLEETLKEERDTELPIFGSDGIIDATMELVTNREWIELGSQILIMPGGGHRLYYGSGRGEKGVAGLDGFVGKVIEVVG